MAYTYFTAPRSDRCDLRYEMDWGDGSIGSINPWWASHIYEESGNYRVCLDVIGTSGEGEECILSFCTFIDIDCDGEKGEGKDSDVTITSRSSISDEIADVTIYPNPAFNEFDLKLSGTWGESLNLEIRDIQGRGQSSFVSPNFSSGDTHKVDISAFNSGTYLIRISDELGNIKIKKLVKI